MLKNYSFVKRLIIAKAKTYKMLETYGNTVT